MSEEKKNEILGQEKELNMDEMDAVAGGGTCACVLGGGGAAGEGQKMCACPGFGSGGYTRDGIRCFCVAGGGGTDDK